MERGHLFSLKPILVLLILQVCLAYKSCTAEELDIRWLKSRCRSKDQYVFEEFCGIVTEYRQQVRIERSQSEAVYYGEANHLKNEISK